MALSDYMPYGAPELLDGASPRMARATFLASGLVAALVCCAGLIASSRPTVQEVPIGPMPKFFPAAAVATPPAPWAAPRVVNFSSPSKFPPVQYAPAVRPKVEEPRV